MSVEGTNRITSFREQYAKKISLLVSEKERKRKANFHRSFLETGKRLMKCSQCKRSFDAKIGKAQIENKRENAPICIPCIMGIPRRDINTLSRVGETISHYSEKTKEKLKLFKQGKLKYKKEIKVIPVEESPFGKEYYD